MYDAVVVGSGPNGLAAAVELSRRGASVCVLEARDQVGGGTRSGEVTLPGFVHDICSGVHPMGILSPYFRTLPLEEHGLTWIRPEASVAHPLDNEPAVMLYRSVETTTANLDGDGESWRSMVEPFLKKQDALMAEVLSPLSIPRHPLFMARLGLYGLRSAAGLAQSRFRQRRAQALFAGCSCHSILPLEKRLSAAVGLIFALTGHIEDWPVAAGGSGRIAQALASYYTSLGGTLLLSTKIGRLDELPPARVVLFDTDPVQLASIAQGALPAGYLRRLRRYRFGPGVFKMDWALDGPIPWADPRCLQASTVHVGGTLEEIAESERAAWNRNHSDAPYLIVCQQSQFDPTRAPEGKHTGYAYCHVPAGSTRDMTGAIEGQIERFAPGFQDRILARHSTNTVDFETYNPNYVGGAVTGGVADLFQLFTRPVARLNPYTTPNPRIFICSASSPPGGGVHGMCGYYAAKTAWKRMHRYEPTPF